MRITDVLRGQISSQVEIVAGCASERPVGVPTHATVLGRMIFQHIETMQPVLDLMTDRLGEGGFLAVLRLDRGVLERDLGRLGVSPDPTRATEARALAARFTDHLSICLHVALAVADYCLSEQELLQLGRSWGEERGLVFSDRIAPPARGPGGGPASY